MSILEKLKKLISKVQVVALDPNTQYLWRVENPEAAGKLQRIINMARPSSANKIKDIMTDKTTELIQGQLVTIPIYATCKTKTELLNIVRDAIGDNLEKIQSIYLDATGITIKIFVPYSVQK